jgi:DNA-binding MarR family transcriptional regulator
MKITKLDRKYSPTPLHHLMFILQQNSDDILLGEVGISLSHVRIMGVLDYSVPCSQKSIAGHLKQTEANVSRQLLSMVRQGFVKVTKNKDDSRQRDVTLTAKGQRRYEGAETSKTPSIKLSIIYKQKSTGLNRCTFGGAL